MPQLNSKSLDCPRQLLLVTWEESRKDLRDRSGSGNIFIFEKLHGPRRINDNSDTHGAISILKEFDGTHFFFIQDFKRFARHSHNEIACLVSDGGSQHNQLRAA